jgi:hypothetical protein
MSRNSQLLVLVAVLILVALAWLFPRPTGADVPAVPGREALIFAPLSVVLPSSVGSATVAPRSAGPYVGTRQTPALQPRTSAGGRDIPTREEPAPSPSLRAVPRLAAERAVSSQAGAPTVTGIASWYAYIPGGAAAGPALRTALGPGWRGMSVAVCRTNGGAMACVRVTLSDFMRADRLIDLDSASFAALMPLSRGLVTVEVLAP